MSNYSAYTKARDIAHKRASRLEAQGLSEHIHIPTVKELKAAGISPQQAMKQLEHFLKAPSTVREFKRIEESQRPVFISDKKGPIVTNKQQE